MVLAGCAGAAKPTVGPWGYEFGLGTFSDQRPDDDAKLMAAAPFTVDGFMTGWRHGVGRTIFANEAAKLDISLKKYEATRNGVSFAMSMEVGLRGRNMANRPLGTMTGTCSAIERADAAAWGDFWQQARTEGNAGPLTQAARDATMWQKVMDSCVKDLATQFGNVLAAGTR